MLVRGPEEWRKHLPWAVATALVTALGGLWYVLEIRRNGGRWPSGGSLAGLSLGIAGGGLILFEMLLWPRKVLRRFRLGRTKRWMMAHIWLGLLTLPLLLLHGGFHFDPSRSSLAAVLMILLVVVVASGIFGLAVQNILPRRMLDMLPAETITAQIPHVLSQYREEAEELVDALCGTSPDTAGPSYRIVTRVREAGRMQGRVTETGVELGRLADAEPLQAFHDQQIRPYLSAGSVAHLPLHNERQAKVLLDELRAKLSVEALPAVDRLADLCQLRRQYDLQIRYHRWLHVWLVVHFATLIALTLLMVAHVVLALRYL